jgi:cytochrome c-type biogenesis protein CcmH
MRRWLLPMAVVGLAVLGIAVLVMVFQPAPTLSTDEQARRLAAELRCPDCQGLSVAESHTAAADAIRAEIAAQLAAGRSADEVRQHFVDRYGSWILLEPADPLIWLLPVAVVAIGVAAFAWWLLGGRSRRSERTHGPPPDAAEDEDARRAVRDELEALDG